MLNVVAAVQRAPAGTSVRVAVETSDDVEAVQRWCAQTGNSVLTVHSDAIDVYRGRITDPIAALPESSRPGYRLWVYTNFHCNLACDYCCVSSSPKAEPRVISTTQFAAIVTDAAAAGVKELFLTGGEPFMLLDLDERIHTATSVLPTTILTNGMLGRGERLRRLESLPREHLTLQISLDSATPKLHDLHRGPGSHATALIGIRSAIKLGFNVRVAATLSDHTRDDSRILDDLFDELRLRADQRVVRRVARQGAANGGLVVSRASLIPEICVTADGAYWHPVAAADPTMMISPDWQPLEAVIGAASDEYRKYRIASGVLASSFPCA